MRTTLTQVVHAIEADEFGLIATSIARAMLSGEKKRERKARFNQLKKLYSVAYPGEKGELLAHISVGVDKLGTLILYFHFERLA
jgi:hypothetical protein